MSQLFSTLHNAQRGNQLAKTAEGRDSSLQMAIVTNVTDPEQRRRIKCTVQSKGGQTETNWLYRLTPHPYDDPPLPRVGQTVAIAYLDGDPHQGVYFGSVTNAPNPERTTTDPLADDSRLIEGDQLERVDRKYELSVGQNLIFKNDAGSRIELKANGDIVIAAAGEIIMSSGVASTLQGKQICVLGAVDNDGDIEVLSGQ